MKVIKAIWRLITPKLWRPIRCLACQFQQPSARWRHIFHQLISQQTRKVPFHRGKRFDTENSNKFFTRTSKKYLLTSSKIQSPFSDVSTCRVDVRILDTKIRRKILVSGILTIFNRFFFLANRGQDYIGYWQEAHMDGAVGKSSILTFAPNTKSSLEFNFNGLYYVA